MNLEDAVGGGGGGGMSSWTPTGSKVQNRAPWKYFLFTLFTVCFKLSALETS